MGIWWVFFFKMARILVFMGSSSYSPSGTVPSPREVVKETPPYGNSTNNHKNNSSDENIPLCEESGGGRRPRVLFLGDSISRATFTRLVNHSWSDSVYLAEPDVNCWGFDRYFQNNSLHEWLGPCSWDVIQFNVGAHFHPE